jgi:hypothetical protein
VRTGIRRYLFVGIAVLAGIAELLALLRARRRYGPGFR